LAFLIRLRDSSLRGKSIDMIAIGL